MVKILAVSAHPPKAYLVREHFSEVFHLLRNGQVFHLIRINIAYETAIAAYKMMMPIHVGVVAGRAGFNLGFSDKPFFLKQGKRPVNGISRYRGYPLMHMPVDRFRVGVFLRAGKKTKHLKTLVRYLQVFLPERLFELAHPPVEFFLFQNPDLKTLFVYNPN